MTIARVLTSRNLPQINLIVATLTLLVSPARPAVAQMRSAPIVATNTIPSLPDAPGFSNSSSPLRESSSLSGEADSSSIASDAAFDVAAARRRLLATRSDITIYPGQTAPPLSAHDKEILGLKQTFTLFTLIGWTASAGYTQLVNGSPNYGTDSGAFGERLGAAALRNTTQNIFGNVIFAPLFHEDPRYYKMGKGHKGYNRILYAASRALITRADDGRTTPNYSLIGGRVVGAALSNTYYPQANRGFGQTAETFGTSMAGAAFGFVVTEFLDEALEIAHLKKPE